MFYLFLLMCLVIGVVIGYIFGLPGAIIVALFGVCMVAATLASGYSDRPE